MNFVHHAAQRLCKRLHNLAARGLSPSSPSRPRLPRDGRGRPFRGGRLQLGQGDRAARAGALPAAIRQDGVTRWTALLSALAFARAVAMVPPMSKAWVGERRAIVEEITRVLGDDVAPESQA